MTDGTLLARALRARWWLVVVVAAVCVASAVFFTARQPRVYRATASAAVVPSADLTEPSDFMRALETLERRTIVATFARIPQAREVERAAAAVLGLADDGLRGYDVEAAVVPGTNVIRVTVTGPDGERVGALANAAMRVTEAEARRMYRAFDLQMLEAAVPARRPFQPEPTRNAAVALVLGLFLGVAAAMGVEALRPAGPQAMERAGA